jgi:RND family efflux transporter MFP subunit
MGDLLFVIDPKEYQAEYNASQAELNAAEAMAHRAKIEYERAQRVYKQGAGRETDVVKWRGERDVARASIERAKAKLERANLNLGYTRITSPISGRISRNLIDVGNLVGEGEPTLLTMVTRYDPMYVYFNLNENDLLRALATHRKRMKEKGLEIDRDSDREAEIPLYLGISNEEGFPHEGVVDFAESSVDPSTGTLQLRGIFNNTEKTLVPGLFTRLRMPISEQEKALLVAERAIGSDQGGRFILTVNSENVVEKRPIRMGQLVDGLRVIEEGVKPGELVVVNGLQRARPGGKVDPEKTEMKTLTISALRAKAEARQDSSKTKQEPSKIASAEPAEDDEKAAENEEKP